MRKRKLTLSVSLVLLCSHPAWADGPIKRRLNGDACLNDRPRKEGCVEGILVQVQRSSGYIQSTTTGGSGAFAFELDVAPEDPWSLIGYYREPGDPRVFYIGLPSPPVIRVESAGPSSLESHLSLKKFTLPSITLLRLPPIDWSRISADSSGPSAEEQQGTPPGTDRTARTFRVSVSSADGKALRGVTVAMEDLSARKGIHRLTASSGSFQEDLPVRSAHTLTVTAPGYAPRSFIVSVDEKGIAMADTSGQWERPDRIVLTPLDPAASEDWLSVRFQDADGSRRNAFPAALMEALPLAPIRTVDTLALLEPGVAPAPETYGRRGPGIATGLGTAGQFSVNGLRSRENDFTVDAADNNDEDTGVRRQGFLIPLAQPMESLEVLQIVTANADPRFGRTIGGQVNIISKLAGNRFHGEVYGLGSDSRFNARDFFNPRGSPVGAIAGGREAITASGLPGGGPVNIDPGPFLLPGFSYVNGAAFQPAPDFRKDPQTRVHFGAAVGGPIVPNQSYLFLSFERILVHESKSTHFATPTVAQRGFSSLPSLPNFPGGPAGLFPDTLSGNAVFSLYPFPNDAAGPYGANTYTTRLPADSAGTIYSLKLDQAITHRRSTSIMARFNGTDESSTVPAVGGAVDSSVRPVGSTENAVAVLTSAIAPRISNSFRFSYGRSHTFFQEVRDPSLLASSFFPDQRFLLNRPVLLNITSPGQPVQYVSSLTPDGQNLVLNAVGGFKDSLGATESYLGAIGQERIAGFSPVGLDTYHFPQDRNQQTFQWSETFLWRHGRHTLQAGLDIRRLQLDSVTERNNRPLLEFHGLRQLPPVSATSLPPSQLVFDPLEMAAGGAYAGLMQTLGVTNDFSLRLHRTTIDTFVVDQFRASDRLNLTFGIRLEFNRLPKDLDPRLQLAFDPTAFKTEVTRAQQACPNSGSDVQTCLDVIAGAQAQLSGDLGKTYGQDRVGNDPRVAFAWDAFGQGSGILRGGFGVYTAQFPMIVLNESRSTFPSFAPLNLGLNFATLIRTANFATNATLGERVAGTLGTIDTTNPATPNLLALIAGRFGGALQLTEPAQAIKNPYAYQYNLTWDQRVASNYGFDIAYVGTAAHHLLRSWTPYGGAYLPGIGSFSGLVYFFGTSPFPTYSALPPLTTATGERFGRLPVRRTLLEGTGNSSFESLQAAFYRRPSSRLQFRSSLTYGHAIDDTSDFLDLAGTDALPQDSAKRSERGPSSYDVRLRSVTYWVFETPLRRNRKWLTDCQVGGILTLQTGQPFTVGTAIDWNADGNLTDRIQNAGNLQPGPIGGDRRIMLAVLDPALLAAPRNPDGSLNYSDGAVGRNTWRAGGIANLDLGASVALFQRDAFRVSLRVESYNLFNRPHFALPVRIVEAPGFGQSVSTTVPNREIQFALKVSF